MCSDCWLFSLFFINFFQSWYLFGKKEFDMRFYSRMSSCCSSCMFALVLRYQMITAVSIQFAHSSAEVHYTKHSPRFWGLMLFCLSCSYHRDLTHTERTSFVRCRQPHIIIQALTALCFMHILCPCDHLFWLEILIFARKMTNLKKKKIKWKSVPVT